MGLFAEAKKVQFGARSKTLQSNLTFEKITLLYFTLNNYLSYLFCTVYVCLLIYYLFNNLSSVSHGFVMDATTAVIQPDRSC